MKPSELAGISAYRFVEKLFADHLDMQFADLRVLLQLPSGPFTAGCGFAAAAVLTNLLGGLSVVLYDRPGFPPPEDRKGRTTRYKALIKDHFPVGAFEPSPDVCADVIYSWSRNQLAHALGLRFAKDNDPKIRLWKRPLQPHEIDELERSSSRPTWLGRTVHLVRPEEYRLSVPALYWGTWRVLERLVGDKAHMMRVEADMQAKKWAP